MCAAGSHLTLHRDRTTRASGTATRSVAAVTRPRGKGRTRTRRCAHSQARAVRSQVRKVSIFGKVGVAHARVRIDLDPMRGIRTILPVTVATLFTCWQLGRWRTRKLAAVLETAELGSRRRIARTSRQTNSLFHVETTLSLIILFAWSFAAATILPLSSEVPLALVVRSSGGWLVPVLVATAGNLLGAGTTYWLGRGAGILAAPASARVQRAAALLARYGPPAMLLSWVPLIGDVLVAMAGAAAMPFWRFAAWTAAGKLARYIAVALAVQHV